MCLCDPADSGELKITKQILTTASTGNLYQNKKIGCSPHVDKCGLTHLPEAQAPTVILVNTTKIIIKCWALSMHAWGLLR